MCSSKIPPSHNFSNWSDPKVMLTDMGGSRGGETTGDGRGG